MESKDYVILHIKTVNSTNDFVRGLGNSLKQDNPFVVVRTDYQTGGRGQIGNSWESEAGKNLLFSVLYRPYSIKASSQFTLSQAIALSIKEVLSLYTKNVTIKWPNDIYVGDKKICGILIENDLKGKSIESCIIGVGLNVNQKMFPVELPNPVSLTQLINMEIPITELLDLIMMKFKAYVASIESKKYSEMDIKYQNSLYRKDGYYDYIDKYGIFSAKINGVTTSGTLLLEDDKGDVREYGFKEVSFVQKRRK